MIYFFAAGKRVIGRGGEDMKKAFKAYADAYRQLGYLDAGVYLQDMSDEEYQTLIHRLILFEHRTYRQAEYDIATGRYKNYELVRARL